MKSGEIALLFFIIWSIFLECVIIYQYFKRRVIEKELSDRELEILHLHKDFTKK